MQNPVLVMVNTLSVSPWYVTDLPMRIAYDMLLYCASPICTTHFANLFTCTRLGCSVCCYSCLRLVYVLRAIVLCLFVLLCYRLGSCIVLLLQTCKRSLELYLMLFYVAKVSCFGYLDSRCSDPGPY